MVTGDGVAVSEVALRRPATWPASTSPGRRRTFQQLWRTVGEQHRRATAATRGWSARPAARTSSSRTRSADLDVLRTALVRGAFEYQGQKCSAASRAYVPRSVWQRLDDDLRRPRRGAARWATSRDLSNFIGAVIDDRAFARLQAAIERAARDAGRRGDRRRQVRRQRGLFRPADRAAVRRPDRRGRSRTEYFGPILAVHVYDDADYDATCSRQLDVGVAVRPDRRGHRPGPRGDRRRPPSALRFAAGNFYVNDKPTGAVVGQQPFGGARASGTNDKAGSAQNLLRWTSHPLDQGDLRPADRPPLPAHGR